MPKKIQKEFICIYLPYWSTELQRRRKTLSSSSAIALLTQHANQTLIARACMRAKANGVREGMCFEMARTLCPDLKTEDFQPEEDFKRLYQLAVWALQFSPLVGIDQSMRIAYQESSLQKISPLHNGLILDISGTTRLHGSSKALAKRILSKLKLAKIPARIGIGPSLGSAWALSRFQKSSGREQIFYTDKQSLHQEVETLSVAALRLPEDIVSGLHELGIQRISQVLKLPRKELFSRFGSFLQRRIDELFGHIEETFPIVRSKEDISVKQSFEFPLFKKESIEKSTLRLVEKITLKLAQNGKKASSFLLTFQGQDKQEEAFSFHKEITLNAASYRKEHLLSIISSVLEGLKIPRGISSIIISSKHTERAHGVQEDCLKNEVSPLHSSSTQVHEEFLNNIVTRLGKNRVSALELYESHIPEESFSYKAIRKKHSQKSRKEQQGISLVFDYPSKLFEQPKPIKAVSLLPDKPPSRIQWDGKSLKIVKSIGPERLSEQWWKSTIDGRVAERDYFKIQDHHGRWFWVYRNQEDFSWFVHGVWG